MIPEKRNCYPFWRFIVSTGNTPWSILQLEDSGRPAYD
jgi:hypothetical protein